MSGLSNFTTEIMSRQQLEDMFTTPPAFIPTPTPKSRPRTKLKIRIPPTTRPRPRLMAKPLLTDMDNFLKMDLA